MNNSAYWKKRFEAIESSAVSKGASYYSTLEKQYLEASKRIEQEISTWYQRFAVNNEISLAEARKLLNSGELKEFKWTVQDYIKYGELNALDASWMKQLENASAKVHISRLEALKIQMQQQVEVLYGNQVDDIDKLAKRIYSDTYYHTAYEIQKGFNVGWDLPSFNDRQLEKVLSKPWTSDNMTFRDKCWKRKDELVATVQTQLTQGILRGDSPDKAIKAISDKFKVDKSKAGRLVMTESAYFAADAQKKCFTDLDVDKVEIVATLDSHTSEICQEMDGKIVDMKDYEPGVTVPPFHPWCRSTTVPYFPDNYGERAARNEKGETYYVPSDMKYGDWKKSFVDGTPETKEELQQLPISKEEAQREIIKELEKIKNSGMKEDDYNEYLGIINNSENPDIHALYQNHADEVRNVRLTSNNGEYSPSSNRIEFDYPAYSDMNKYGTLSHEYGHFFDAQVQYDGLHFDEITKVKDVTGLTTFKPVASSSDEFLEAIRKDKAHLKEILTPEVKSDLIKHNASSGVQDAIDGLFTKSRIRWGHGEKYYNRKYNSVAFLDKFSSNPTKLKDLKQAYTDLGFDASNQTKVKAICRQYEAASEAWANIMSAETCGGEALEYVKKFLPNSYKALLQIIKGAK